MSTTSRTSSWSTSATIESIERETCGPRNDGLAQNPHRLSHPSATFTYAHGRSRPWPRQVQQVEAGNGSPTRDEPCPGGPVGSCTECGHAGIPEPGDGIGLRQGIGQFVAVPLGHAPGDHEPRPFGAPFIEGQDRCDRLLARLLDERTGVHHHQVGIVGRVGSDESVGGHRSGQLVGIDLVLGAAEGLDPEGAGHGRASLRVSRRRDASTGRVSRHGRAPGRRRASPSPADDRCPTP